MYCLLVRLLFLFVFFFKQKTAYELRISDWSSDVCSSDLSNVVHADPGVHYVIGRQILAILRAKFRSMEPVTVQNEFAVERPHRKHPVRGHRAGEAGSISRNL